MKEEVKLLIKEAVLEALAEYANQGVSTLAEDKDESGKGGGSEETGGGGVTEEGRPKPDVGVGVFGLR